MAHRSGLINPNLLAMTRLFYINFLLFFCLKISKSFRLSRKILNFLNHLRFSIFGPLRPQPKGRKKRPSDVTSFSCVPCHALVRHDTQKSVIKSANPSKLPILAWSSSIFRSSAAFLSANFFSVGTAIPVF